MVTKVSKTKYWIGRTIGILTLVCILMGSIPVQAQGPTYTQLNDVYYAVEGCTVYAEPTYTSTVLTTIAANVPVRVVGSYSNGWYRINIGVIAYCKMDSLTTAGDVGVITAKDTQAYYAKQTADQLGYTFHYMVLNDKKTIKKDIFNSYIGQKAILFAKIDDELAVSFKMLYADPVKQDINLNYTRTVTVNGVGSRTIELTNSDEQALTGQLAIFQVKAGYDKAVDMYIWDMNNAEYNLMNTYYTEFSEYAYAPVTQISNIKYTEAEIANSLTTEVRTKMDNIRRGIKYLSYDETDYKNALTSRLRKDTEYVDFQY